MKIPTRDIPGHETFYVECECGEDERETLFEKLRNSAIEVQLHDDQQGMYQIKLIIM